MIKEDQAPVKVEVAVQQAVIAESEPPRVRRYRAVVFRIALFIIAFAFAGLTLLVKINPSLSIDLQITRSVQMINLPNFGLLMGLISWPGFSPQSIIITVLIILLIYGLGLHWEAVVMLIAAILTSGIGAILKDLIQRPRPTPNQANVFDTLNNYSFPSGHVLFYVGFFGFMGFLVYSLLKPSKKRGVLLVIIGGPIALIGISRIYLGEHWASDVLGSYLLGSLILVALVQIYLWGKTRFFVNQPVAPAEPQKA